MLGPSSDELLGGDHEVLVGSEVGRFDDVEGEKRVNTVDHVVGGVTGSTSNSDPFGPEDLRQDLAPSGLVAVTGLHDSLANVVVLGLNETVGAGVVARDADMVDVILASEDVERSDVGGSVVGDYLGEGTPATEDVTEDEVGNDFSRVGGGGASFGVGGKSAASVDDIAVGAGARHEESIDVDLSEEGGDDGDGRRDEEVLSLADLTLVASPDEPLDILIESWPPEAKEEVASGSADALVAEVVVSILDQAEAFGGVGD